MRIASLPHTDPDTALLAENPLAAGLDREPIHPTALVVFGAHRRSRSGASCCRVLYNRRARGASLPEHFTPRRGRTRRPVADADFRAAA